MAGARLGNFLGGPVRDTQTPELILRQSADALGIAEALGAVGAGLGRRRAREEAKKARADELKMRQQERASDRAFTLKRDREGREFTLQRDANAREFRRELETAEHAKGLMAHLQQQARELQNLERIRNTLQQRGGDVTELNQRIQDLQRGAPGLSQQLVNLSQSNGVSRPEMLREDPSTLFNLAAETQTGIDNAIAELREARKTGDQRLIGKASENLSRLRSAKSTLDARAENFEADQKQKAGFIVKRVQAAERVAGFARYAQDVGLGDEDASRIARALANNAMTPAQAIQQAGQIAEQRRKSEAEQAQRQSAVDTLGAMSQRLGVQVPDDISQAVMAGNMTPEQARDRVESMARIAQTEQRGAAGDEGSAQIARDAKTILTEMRRREGGIMGGKRIADPFFGMRAARLGDVVSAGLLGREAEEAVFAEIGRVLGRELSPAEREAIKSRDPVVYGKESKDARR